MSDGAKGREGQAQKKACPQCGKTASGNFCRNCGAQLGGRFCNQCGAAVAGGAGFCNQCGNKVGGAGAGSRRAAAAATVGGGNAPWWIAGVAMFGVIVVMGWSAVRPGPPPTPGSMGAPAGGAGAAGAGAAGVDLSAMSPTDAANRLFDRVMGTLEAGDTAGALGFQPMAVQAHESLEPLDMDGLFHLAMLEILVDPSAALVTAQRMLDVDADHVLGLGMAARSAIGVGEEDQAAAHYQRLLDVFDGQSARPLPEYQGHQNSLTQMQREAQAFLAPR